MTRRTRIRRAGGYHAAQFNKTVLGVTAMWKRLAAAALLMILGSASGSVLAAPAGSDPGPDVDARVYIFRGDLGIFFSTGMDYLAAELNQRGLNAGVYPWENWKALADDAIAYYRAHPHARIMLAGHSRGGDGLVAMSWRLHDAHVPVALAVAVDPTRVVGKIPPNVERFINLYQSNNMLGGGAAQPTRAFHGTYATVNLAERIEMTHVTIDKAPALHQAIIPKFIEAARYHSPPPGSRIGIEYRVPAGAPIEVWDSGMQVSASADDTADTVGRRYGVPAWVVAQLNKVSAEERIAAGRTLIVPRMAYAPGTGTGDPALADAFVSVLLSGIKPDPAPLPEGTTEVSEKTEP
jgi:pimeloyl-ACP methyl ester carboxylesterase